MFKSAFQIEQLDDKYFMLLQDLVYESEEYGLKIRVPEGFVSDGPSVPRVPFLFFLFGNKGKRAAVIHDWLYRNELAPRDIADGIFREALLGSNKGFYTAYGMWLGVRGFGWMHYGNKHGCLDIRTKCDNKCDECKHSFKAYRLSCVKTYKE